MHIGILYRIVLLALPFISPLASAQAARIESSAGASYPVQGRILRETTDPAVGTHWLWIADPSHPEWPSHLVMAQDDAAGRVSSVFGSSAAILSAASARRTANPVIHAGDIVALHQESGPIRAVLQALALNAAPVGGALRVRLIVTSDRREGMNYLLTSSGPVLTATAIGRGEARWIPAGAPVAQEQRQ